MQVLVSDEADPQGLQIDTISFNGTRIPLKPRDIYGFRGQASFQVIPNETYVLRWNVYQDKINWPRITTHKEEIHISPKDLWIQIYVVGDKVTIE